MSIWNSYNNLLISDDITRVQKLITRYELFKLTENVPGDIIECGVFKGAGLFFWLKLLVINNLHYSKKVIGFDTFDSFSNSHENFEKKNITKYIQSSKFKGTKINDLKKIYKEMNLKQDCFDLVKGDIIKTSMRYVKKNQGCKISLLNLDLDTGLGTKAALESFFPLMSKGGIIILDEYAVRGWGETEAVDSFLKDRNLKINAIKGTKSPSAYIVIE